MGFFATLAAAIWPDASSVNKAQVRAWALTVETKIGEDGWTHIIKQADQAKTSDASLANDSELSFAMAASTKYRVSLKVWFDTAATPDFKYAVVGPSSPTLVRSMRKHIDPNALTTLASAAEISFPGATVNAGTGTTGGYIEIDMIVHNGLNAGTLAFQWAQNTSNGSATTVLAGSELSYRKVTP